MKKQVIQCDIGTVPSATPKGTVITMQVSVNEAGKITGLSGPLSPAGLGDAAAWRPVVVHIFGSCKFAPYVVDVRVTYYKGNLELIAP
jgi:hypothetical protein